MKGNKFMVKNILRSLVALAILTSCPLWAAENSEMIIDVRTKNEWDAGHLETAFHLPLDVFEANVAALVTNKTQVVYLYCRSGNRSGQALQIMQHLGYSNAVNAGGIGDASQRLKTAIIH
jgi:phage shock protein E